MKLLSVWNLDFTSRRKENARRAMRNNLHLQPKGKGNRAWKRVEAMNNDPASLIWPNYLA